MSDKDQQRYSDLVLSKIKERPIKTRNGVKSTTWSNPGIVRVSTIDLPGRLPDGKYCQFICAVDGEGVPIEMNYTFDDLMFELAINLTGKQLYKIKYYPATDTLRCQPVRANPPQEIAPIGKNVWEEKDLRITKMSCIRSAVEFYSNAKIRTERNIIETAEKFRKYVYGEDQ